MTGATVQTSSVTAPTAPTPSQTVGPFFRFCFECLERRDLVTPGSAGAVELRGGVFDGDGDPVDDAVLEICQADGRFGRCLTDDRGHYRFTIAKAAAGSPVDAPHLDVSIFARGLLQRVVTRVYFPDESEANVHDRVLAAIADPGDRATLVAVPDRAALRFDVHLQPTDRHRETVFFAW